MLAAAPTHGGCVRWTVVSCPGSERLGSSTSGLRGAARWVRAPESHRRRRVAASSQAGGSSTSSSSDEDPEMALKPSQTARARGGPRYSALTSGRGSSKDEGDAGAARTKASAATRRTSRPKDAEARREQRRRSSARKPWMTESTVNLTAKEEQACGAAIQELLTIETMATQLAEESIAAELRDEKGAGDPFSVDFGKKKKKRGPTSGASSLAVTPGIGRDMSSPAFRRELARAMGFTSPAQLKERVDAGQEARRVLVTRNVGLARTVAADIHAKLNDADRGLLSVSDLMQEGCAGLATAADKFDPQRGYRFSTYAFFWIKKAVIDCVGNSGRTIRLPIHVNENIQKMKKATRELKEIKVRDPTEDELADRLGWSVVKLRQMKVWAFRTPVSMDATTAKKGDPWEDADDAVAEAASLNAATQSSDFGTGLNAPSDTAEADVDADLLRMGLEEVFSTLLPREAFILRHRFGLAAASTAMEGGDWLKASRAEVLSALQDDEGMGTRGGANFKTLGNLLGVSSESVRTYERRALAKLKQPDRIALLLPHLNMEKDSIKLNDTEEFVEALNAAIKEADDKTGGKVRASLCMSPRIGVEGAKEEGKKKRPKRRGPRKVKQIQSESSKSESAQAAAAEEEIETENAAAKESIIVS